MTKIKILGTASAVPDQNHLNTHFVLESADRSILVDCSGNPFARFDQAGLDPMQLTDMIITHFHPDHVMGVPLLLMDLWISGRKDPINLYGLEEVIDRIQSLMALFEWETWEAMFPINFVRLSEEEGFDLLKTEDVSITGLPTCHILPSICLRFELHDGVICYSGDTAPCENVVRLAEEADILIHEASGEYFGHSSAKQAGEIASKAGVKSLFLIHYPPDSDPEKLLEEAGQSYSGEVVIAEDLMDIVLEKI
jgi:ribonuclease Z